MIPAIILAAGASSRMGRIKALLPLPGGDCFLTRIAKTFHAAGVEHVVAVVGRDAPAIRAALDAAADHADGGGAARGEPAARTPRLHLVENMDPARGQLSSVVVGLDDVCRRGGSVPAVLVTTVDLPLVSLETVRRVIAAWHATGAPIVRPAREGRHGHPAIFGAVLFHELRAADPRLGARPVVRAHDAQIVDVPVDDPGAFDDIDTPDDYARIVGK